ncbi:hypothetical protein LZ32DRAFT_426137 [Colletotrichum eremochloae]|nr:hypothetical protein LZ32DRAFT_426137 [Colletotrichum eremochloae]
MHWSIVPLIALTILATRSFAIIIPRNPYHSCGDLPNVPLSPDPEHSTFNFILDPSVQAFIKETNTAAFTLNTVHLYQVCAPTWTDYYPTTNEGYAPIDKFGPQNPYIITTDRCEKGYSRSPDGYVVTLCAGNGTSCTKDSPAPPIQCTPWYNISTGRPFCPVSEPDGGNAKAVSLTDPLPWKCEICKLGRCPPVFY